MTAAACLLLAATFTRPMERVVSMDPLLAQSIYDSHAIQLVYETPLEVDYEARPYRLVPGLCALPEVSADGLVYTFRLVPREPMVVKAPDVVRCLKRLQDPANASPGGWTMKDVASFEVVDEGTFVIRLRNRSHVFPWMMAMSYAAVVASDGSGTGPYRLTSWRKNHEMLFERNPAWPGWATRPDAFDAVRYLVVGDVSTQWLMFLKNEVDLLGEVSRDNWDAVVTPEGGLDPRLEAEGVRLFGSENLQIRYIGMNMRDPLLGSNRKLRQALSCAFDFPTWKRFMNNRVEFSDGPVPRGVEGHLDEPPPYSFDLERAKRLLAEAGYPGGIDPQTGRRLAVTLSIGRVDGREDGELLASFYEKIGVKLELSFSTWGAFLKAVDEGRVQLYMMGWVGDYPDAENFLQLFYSKNRSPGPNHSCYANDEFDRSFEAAMAADSAEVRNAHWRRCQEIVREDCPWIFTHFPKSYTIVRPTVKNYIPGDFPYGQEKNLRHEDAGN